MGSPRELLALDDAKKSALKAGDQFSRPPDGWIMADGKPMAIWIPAGETPETIGLTTFRPNGKIGRAA